MRLQNTSMPCASARDALGVRRHRESSRPAIAPRGVDCRSRAPTRPRDSDRNSGLARGSRGKATRMARRLHDPHGGSQPDEGATNKADPENREIGLRDDGIGQTD